MKHLKIQNLSLMPTSVHICPTSDYLNLKHWRRYQQEECTRDIYKSLMNEKLKRPLIKSERKMEKK